MLQITDQDFIARFEVDTLRHEIVALGGVAQDGDLIGVGAEELRGLLSRFLTGNGFRVTAASDAAEARALLKSLAFDALVLDVMMPGENGLDLTTSLRQDSKLPYHRAEFKDTTWQLGGPAKKDKLWFFGSFQYQKDADSQPGTDPAVADLLTDRFGEQVVARSVDPMLGGVYAGSAATIGLRSAAPSLAAGLDAGATSVTS